MKATTQNRNGFALPAALIVITVLFAVMVPTLQVVNQQTMISKAVEAVSDDELTEEGGYVDLLSHWHDDFYRLALWADTLVLRTTADSTLARIRVTRTTDQLFLLESLEKRNNAYHVLSALTVRAGPLRIAPKAAATVVGQSNLTNRAHVHGWDEHPVTWPGLCTNAIESDQNGVLTPDAANVVMGPGTTISGYPPTGVDPTMTVTALEDLGDATFAALAAHANHELVPGWSGVPTPQLSGGGCMETKASVWGDPFDPHSPCGNFFPVVHALGDATIRSGGTGQGILLVEGDVTIEEGVLFLGIIVAKGRLTLQSTGLSIKGAVYANEMQVDGMNVVDYQLRYSSCVIDRVQDNLQLLDVRPIESRSWMPVGATPVMAAGGA